MYIEGREGQQSAFKVAERSYKAVTTLEGALELGAIDFPSDGDIDEISVTHYKRTLLGREVTVYGLHAYPGLYVIKDSLSRRAQVELAYHSLSESLSAPNRTNLHCHNISEEMREVLESNLGIWNFDGPKLDKEEYIGIDPARVGKKNQAKNRLPLGSTLSKVRWATLGYQYNWTERSYSPDRHVSIPLQIRSLASVIAETCCQSIVPEAGIVNFYPEGQVMGGHRDDGEEARENPVVSVSIGSPCVFLLGGHSKDEAPTALILRSGDTILLAGDTRLRYHGVSKVFVDAVGPPASLHPSTYREQTVHKAGCPQFLGVGVAEEDSVLPPAGINSNNKRARESLGACTCQGVAAEEVLRALKVLACCRINVNLRQVYCSRGKGGALT